MLSRGNNVNGKPGPEECTGRFATREELEMHVHYLRNSTTMTRQQIADDAGISVGTVQSIIKKPLHKEVDPFIELKRKTLRNRW